MAQRSHGRSTVTAVADTEAVVIVAVATAAVVTAAEVSAEEVTAADARLRTVAEVHVDMHREAPVVVTWPVVVAHLDIPAGSVHAAPPIAV